MTAKMKISKDITTMKFLTNRTQVIHDSIENAIINGVKWDYKNDMWIPKNDTDKNKFNFILTTLSVNSAFKYKKDLMKTLLNELTDLYKNDHTIHLNHIDCYEVDPMYIKIVEKFFNHKYKMTLNNDVIQINDRFFIAYAGNITNANARMILNELIFQGLPNDTTIIDEFNNWKIE